MPKVHQPFNLVFLGKFDLTHPHIVLNLLQSALIAILETLYIFSSPYKIARSDVVRLELTLPVVSFAVFMFLPAGKKLFVITTLCFSIGFKLMRIAQRLLKRLGREEHMVAPAAPISTEQTLSSPQIPHNREIV